MNDELIKTCGMCGMEIPEAAKKCPHCQSWQYKSWGIMHHPLFAILMIWLLSLPILIFYGTIQDRLFTEGEIFSKYSDQLKIENEELKFGIRSGSGDENAKTAVVLGKIINSTEIPWDDVVLEVQFFDKQKKLIDTNQLRPYRLMVPSSGECVFKISTLMEFPQEQYHSAKVFIKSADDQRAMF